MERSLLGVKGSLLVAVPKDWADEIGLSKGARVRFKRTKEGLLMQAASPSSAKRVFTIGYEGYDLLTFVAKLRANGVEQLADVRERPLSRKKGFSKNGLAAALAANGIEYRHIRELGAPPELRRPFVAGGPFDDFEKGYRRHLARHEQPLDALAGLSNRKKTAVMCLEKDHRSCHRQFLAERLSQDGFDVQHL